MTCPCCRVTNTLIEFQRHPSITAFKALENAVKSFAEAKTEVNVQLIRKCMHHCQRLMLDCWFDNILKDARTVLNGGYIWRHRRQALS